MSYNGSGVFQINSSGQPVVTGTVISSTAFNALTADLATGLSTAITKDGQTTTTARVPFAQGISSTLTTDATSATTGSIITAGGISTQKALWVGTTSRHVGATQFDAAITYGGVTLSNAVTGTGNMVLSASPTLTGTVNTQNVQPTADATHNIGGASNRYAGAFAGHLSDGSQAAGEMVGSGGTTMRLANGSGWTGISTTKSLGIGMTPSNVLDITQNQNGNSVVAILNSDGGASATTRYRLRNGTTTSEFQLFGSGFTPTGVYRANGLLVENSGAGGVTINAAAAQPIYFGINSSEVARFDTSGSLLVGTTSNATTSRAVFRNTQNVLALDNSGGQYTTMTFCNNNTATAYVYYDNTNSRLYVQTGASGGVYLAATGTSWTAVSDERVKDIIEPIENATDKLAGWRTVIGKYKTDKDGVRRSFLIAQDILKTFPEAVDATEPDEYGVNYQDTIPVLVAAIQELTTRLAALENK